jgi:hypothetical protein
MTSALARIDPASLGRVLAATEASPLLVEERLLRRVIKRHRQLPTFGRAVPHGRCYAIPRDALVGLLSAEEIGRPIDALPEDVILLPCPDGRDLTSTPTPEILVSMWRSAFHARIHVEIERAARAGKLTLAKLRERAHRIGQVELDEIRRVLLQDDLLLPPHDALDTYAELAAVYLELSAFAPQLLGAVFPTLGDRTVIDDALAEDVDAARLLAACRPEGAPEAPILDTQHDAYPIDTTHDSEDVSPATLRIDADDARRRGNVVRSAVARLAASEDGAEARRDLAALAARLDAALTPEGGEDGGAIDRRAWEPILLALAERAARGGPLRFVESRLLYDLQRACLGAERVLGKVDLVDYALSLGKRPLVRMLPATRPILVARELASASKKVARTALAPRDRDKLRALLAEARRRADDNVRASLRPALGAALHDVGLRATSLPEQVARGKLIEELCDHVVARGHLGIGPLRDAISRNQLKLADLRGPGELFGGDALLLADQRLARDLEGVHRRGEIYMRGLQKLSSLLFGTRLGRVLTRTLLLPFGAAFVLLEGVGHMASPIGHALRLLPRHDHVHLLTPISFAVTAAILFGLIHSRALRSAALTAAHGVAFVLAAVFFRAPRWLLTRPLVRRALRSRAALALRRYALKPIAIGAVAVAATPLRHASPPVTIGAGALVFALVNVTLNSRRGIVLEEMALDATASAWRRLHRHVLPGLFRLIADFFRRLTDTIDQGIYAVDEWLRFRKGQSRPIVALKAVLSVAWFAIAYLVRIYVNLLIEPQVNPIKHFPVVTVAAKIMLPFYGALIAGLHHAIARVFGGFVAGTLAAPTVFLLPGIAGFLVWEFKENYKLYRATREATLGPVPIGHHGETMGALQKPGFHSGTLPKLWAKRRSAARKGAPSADKYAEGLRDVQKAVTRFVHRELRDLLSASPAWTGGRLTVARVDLASNRIRVHLSTEGSPDPLVISFEEQSGFLLAGLPRPGFLASLSEADRRLFENALAGLYKLAGVELVREQIASAIGGSSRYDVAEEGLVVWPGGGFATEIVYPLDGRKEMIPEVRGAPPEAPPKPLSRKAIWFEEQPIAWADWVEAWSHDEPTRLLTEGSILPLDFSRSPR